MSSNLSPAERGFQALWLRGEKYKQGFKQGSGTPPFVTSRIPLRGLTNPRSSLNPGEDVWGFFSFCVELEDWVDFTFYSSLFSIDFRVPDVFDAKALS